MESEYKIGKVVWVFKTGFEGEIINCVLQEQQTKYHIRVPSEDDVFVYGAEDLFVFGPQAERNIRQEWAQKFKN